MRKFLPEFNKKYNVEKSISNCNHYRIKMGSVMESDVLRQDDAERKDIKSQIGDDLEIQFSEIHS